MSMSNISIHYVHNQSGVQRFYDVINEELDAIRAAGTFKNERVITSSQKPEINVQGKKDDQVPQLNFCANNYLGLASHPEVIRKSKTYLNNYGAGLSSVRFICGTQVSKRSFVDQSNIVYNTNGTPQNTMNTLMFALCANSACSHNSSD